MLGEVGGIVGGSCLSGIKGIDGTKEILWKGFKVQKVEVGEGGVGKWTSTKKYSRESDSPDLFDCIQPSSVLVSRSNVDAVAWALSDESHDVETTNYVSKATHTDIGFHSVRLARTC